MPPREPKATLPPMSAYMPPQPHFWSCPQCHALCLRTKDGMYLTPALGLAHQCSTHTNEGQ